MTKKPKTKPVRANSAAAMKRNSVSGHLVDLTKLPRGSVPSQSAMVMSDEAIPQPNRPNLQPRPTCEDVDIHRFVSDLLVSDKDIMDYLARC